MDIKLRRMKYENDEENEVEEYDPFFYHLQFPPYAERSRDRWSSLIWRQRLNQ